MSINIPIRGRSQPLTASSVRDSTTETYEKVIIMLITVVGTKLIRSEKRFVTCTY